MCPSAHIRGQTLTSEGKTCSRRTSFTIDVTIQARQVREHIGLVGHYAAVDEILTGRQNLVMFARLNHLSGHQAELRADTLLEQFALMEAGKTPVSTFSGGMRRRLDLVASLIVSPSVLFVDEPTTGLDPAGRREVWTAIRSLVGAGTTVLLTTRYLEEADQLAHRICMLKEGRVIAEGTPDSPQPIHHFLSLQRFPRRFKREEAHPWLHPTCEKTMILFDPMVPVFPLPEFPWVWKKSFCFGLVEGLGISGVLLERNHAGKHSVASAHGFQEKHCGRLRLSLGLKTISRVLPGEPPVPGRFIHLPLTFTYVSSILQEAVEIVRCGRMRFSSSGRNAGARGRWWSGQQPGHALS